MSDFVGREMFLSSVFKYKPTRAIVLGSGMASTLDHMRSVCSVSWEEWPGINVRPGVSGHAGTLNLNIGELGPFLVIKGRLHRYEGRAVGLTTKIATELTKLGIRELVLTCATGGILPEMEPGALARIECLIDMTDAGAWRKWAWEFGAIGGEIIPSSPLAESLSLGATRYGTRLGTTTLAQVVGPAYETKAEIQMLRSIGAGVVGMSSGHEWRAAVSVGIDTQIVALVTNWACGICPEKIDHEAVVRESAKQAARMGAILSAP